MEYKEFKAGNRDFHLPVHYNFAKVVGSGAYGVVINVSDTRDGKNYAIKLCQQAFKDNIDAKRILREAKLLREFDHPNVIKIVDLIPPHESVRKFDDIYIVQELMETDLHRIIYSKQSLSIDHVRYFTYQLLKGLKYIHSANVVHRDLKPANLLINSNCDLKICDFGLARALDDDVGGGLLTQYVVTRWYRAPEILLNCSTYDKEIDVWSAGCILGELLNRSALFQGRNYLETLEEITKKVGTLSGRELDFVTNTRAKKFMSDLPPNMPVPMQNWFPRFSKETQAHDLIRQMLAIDPNRRPNVEQCLAHPFFSTLHNPDDEPSHHAHISFEIDNYELSSVQVKKEFWKEIRAYHPHIAPTFPSDVHDNEFSNADDSK